MDEASQSTADQPAAQDGPAKPTTQEAPAGATAQDAPVEPTAQDGPAKPTAQDGPAKPTDLSRRAWWAALKRTVKQFNQDNLTDWAAVLTYYGVLSLFPGLLVLIAVLRLAGKSTMDKILTSLTAIAPGQTGSVLHTAVAHLEESQQSTAGILAVVGVVAALWSSSGYVGAFMRAANSIYDVPEGRPIWKTIPVRLGVTVLTGVIVTVAALAVLLTGGLAKQLGRLVGLGPQAVQVWDIVKWPVLVILISFVFAVLYWASPNARQGGFRWVSPGGVLAVVLWLIASGGFALYVANFGSYDKTYGALAAVIIFLVWMWISNLAILLGAEFDAELQRGRAIVAGHDPADEPYMALRDDRKISKQRAGDL